MSAELVTQKSRQTTYVYPVCWWWPADVFGAYLFGAILVLVGGFWLLDNLNLIAAPIADLVWPLAILAIGATVIARSLALERR